MVTEIENATARPWHTDEEAYHIYDESENMRICDIRGWGHLIGKGHGALGLDDKAAEKVQRANAALIIKAVNSYESDQQRIVDLTEALEELQTFTTRRVGNHGPLDMWHKVNKALEKL